MKTTLINRFPKYRQVVPVFAVISIMTYSWTIIVFFRLLSISWILFLSTGDILGLLAYQTLTNLIENLAFLGVLLLISALLPKNLLTNDFTVRGTIVSMVFLGSLIVFYSFYEMWQLLDKLSIWLSSFILITALLMVASWKLAPAYKLILSIADRCIIFLYILMPLSFLSLIIVVARNIL